MRRFAEMYDQCVDRVLESGFGAYSDTQIALCMRLAGVEVSAAAAAAAAGGGGGDGHDAAPAAPVGVVAEPQQGLGVLDLPLTPAWSNCESWCVGPGGHYPVTSPRMSSLVHNRVSSC
jgi:hypothetical protein